MSISYHAELLLEFLNSAPSLEFLTLNATHMWKANFVEYKYVEMEPAPRCVTSHLKVVAFINISKRPLLHLAGFFFKNGFELKRVYIEDDTLPSSTITKYIERLHKFPKASAAGVEIFPPGFFFLD